MALVSLRASPRNAASVSGDAGNAARQGTAHQSLKRATAERIRRVACFRNAARGGTAPRRQQSRRRRRRFDHRLRSTMAESPVTPACPEDAIKETLPAVAPIPVEGLPRCESSPPSPDGDEIMLNVLEPGELFGQNRMFDGGTRTASAAANGADPSYRFCSCFWAPVPASSSTQ
jgi:hypothetical protein